MNGWDLFTWLNCVVLAGAAIVIFILFLRHSKGILDADRRETEVEYLVEHVPECAPEPMAERAGEGSTAG